LSEADGDVRATGADVAEEGGEGGGLIIGVESLESEGLDGSTGGAELDATGSAGAELVEVPSATT
jgi:hypothetical protein